MAGKDAEERPHTHTHVSCTRTHRLLYFIRSLFIQFETISRSEEQPGLTSAQPNGRQGARFLSFVFNQELHSLNVNILRFYLKSIKKVLLKNNTNFIMFGILLTLNLNSVKLQTSNNQQPYCDLSDNVHHFTEICRQLKMCYFL